MTHHARASAAARRRMQVRLPLVAPAPRALRVVAADVDRARIPLEGLRKTEAWRAHQRFLDACDRIDDETRERMARYLRNRTGSTATEPHVVIYVVKFGYTVASIARTGTW